MVDLTLADGSVLHSTDNHLIWDATTASFTDAIDLRAGKQLLLADGRRIALTGVWVHTQTLTAYNLEIADIHTYYAGTTPTLVHNSCDISAQAKNIAAHANNRAWDPNGMDHYVRGVNPKALDAYVDGVLEGKVRGVIPKYLKDGRVGYWDPDKGAVVIEEGSGGTVFTPRDGKTFFDDKLE